MLRFISQCLFFLTVYQTERKGHEGERSKICGFKYTKIWGIHFS